MAKFEIAAKIAKVDEELGVVYGWASVFTEKGAPVVDAHGDVIEPMEMVKAAHRFISDARVAKIMHGGEQVGEIVESLVFTADVQKALGIELGFEGWLIGMRVPDGDLRKRVAEGELGAFSIGGQAERS